MKWLDTLSENLKSTKDVTAGEDFADSIALIVIMGLVLTVVFM